MRAGLIAAGTALAIFGGSAGALAVGFDDPASNDPSQQLDGGVPTGPYSNVQRDDTPNDPDYDRAEPDDPGGSTSTNIFSERFDLFGFASARTRATARYLDPGGPNFLSGMVSGFNAAGAWKITRGDPRISVAVLDTGVNWDNPVLRTKVRLNADELPQPRPIDNTKPLSGYDLNGNGYVDVDDYKNDDRVGKPAPTAEDLIKAFSDGRDDDGNGYVDDIAGWDFFDNDNNPADSSSYFAAKNHGSGRAEEAVEAGNDGQGSIGVCPKCTFVPVRVWDTFVSDQNNFFLGVAYAADNGAKVILGASGGLYHSKFAEQASRYAYERGVVQLYSGDDLNTGNHNYPAAYNHAMLVQGVAADAEGLGQELPDGGANDPVGIRKSLIGLLDAAGAGTSVPVRTYFRNANTTQFGGKSSISMQGPTGSTNTGKAAGAAALILSAALQQGITLSPDELRSLMEQTAEDVLPGDTAGAGTPDPAQPGFDTHFGYGRVNVGEAVREAKAGRIPPKASIDSPEWYQPLPGGATVKGLAEARGGAFTWTLEYGVGLAPQDNEWQPVRSGSSPGPAVTDFGTLPMDAIRAALADPARQRRDKNDSGGPVFDPAGTDPYEGQFSIRLRVTKVGSPATKVGEHRKVLTALADPTLRSGFPKRMGAGGEAPLRYADLNGDNTQELVLPTEDGKVHAYRPDGSELPGWPVSTRVQSSAANHLGAPVFGSLDAPLEPPRGPTIADLTGDGKPEVITAAGERIYVWEADGDPLPGWPVRPDPSRANCAPSEQAKELKHPKCGFLATPAVARLNGKDKPFSIVVPGLDGRLRAYGSDGSPVAGFPVRLRDPGLPENEKMTAESINNPAIGDLDGDGKDDIVVATNEVYGGAPSGGGDVGFGGLLATAGSTSRVYAVKSDGTILPGWPVKPGGIIQNVLPLIGPGQDSALVRIGGRPKVVVSVTGSTAMTIYNPDGSTDREVQQSAGGTGALNLFESAAVGDIDGAGGPELVKYQLDLGQAANLLLVGQNVPYSHRVGAYDAQTGAAKAPFPRITDDYQFLSSSTIGKVAEGSSNQVIAGTGLGLLHAYDGITGRDVAGFPKVTGGWLFAPAALSNDGRIAAVTREGYLFEWNAPGVAACQTEWPSFRHDEQGSGNYDRDGTPPGAPSALKITQRSGDLHTLSFRSPGDDGLCGTAARYVADVNGQPLDLGAPVAGGATFTTSIAVPPGAKVTVRAVDEAENSGQPASVSRAPDSPAAGGGNTGGGPGGSGPTGSPGNPGSDEINRAKPRLALGLRGRHGHASFRRRCYSGAVRVTVAGRDAGLARRGRFRMGARRYFDSRRPLSRVYRAHHRGASHLHRARVSVRLIDGRLVKLSRRFRVCANSA